MGNIPIKVSPNPLISSTIEIRFKSNISKNNILGIVYPMFIEDFPTLQDRGIPRISEDNPHFIANYIFTNKDYGLMIDNNVIAFECLNGYPLWGNYETIIDKNINKLFSCIEIEKVERIGLRYINFFPNVKKISDATAINITGFIPNGRLSNLNLQYLIDNCFINLQIQENVYLEEDINKNTGLLIDIDISQDNEIAISEVMTTINYLHEKEKLFFFELLSDAFKQNHIKIEY